MAIDFSKPTTTRNYSTEFVSDLTNNITELSKWLDPSYVTITGTIPTGAKRLNAGVFEQYNGTAWAAISLGYVAKAGDTMTGSLTVSNASGVVRLQGTAPAFQWYKDGTPTKAARLAFNTADTDGLSLGVYNGTSWNDSFRITSAGYIYMTSNVLITTGSNQPLKLETSSASPWAIEIARSDLGFSSNIYNNGTQLYFSHRPSFAGNLALDAANYSTYALGRTGDTANSGNYTFPNYVFAKNFNTSSNGNVTSHLNPTLDAYAMTGGSGILGDGVQSDLFAFNPPTTQEYWNGSTWVSETVASALFAGRMSMAYGSTYSMTPSKTKVRFTWNTFSYRFWDSLMLVGVTAGNNITFQLEGSTNGTSWTTFHGPSNSTASWPGYHHWWVYGNNNSAYPYLRLTIVRDSVNGNNVDLGQLAMYGAYGGNIRLFDWDYQRKVTFSNTLNIDPGTAESLRLRRDDAYISFYNTANSSRAGYLQIVTGGAVTLMNDQAQALYLGTNGSNRLVVNSAGNITVAAPASGVAFTVNQSGGSIVQLLASTGTNAIYQTFNNTGGNFYIGPDSSTGGTLVTSGGAYSFCFVAESARDMNFATNNTLRTKISSGGNVSIYAPASGNTLSLSAASGNYWLSAGDSNATFQGYSDSNGVRLGVTQNLALGFYTNGYTNLRLLLSNAGLFSYYADGGGTGYEVGFRVIPRTTDTTVNTAKRGFCMALTAGVTIPASTYAAGDALSIYNDSASAITITQGASLTLRQAGTTNTGNRTLAARGFCTIWFNSATEAIISGAGVT